MAGLLAGFLLIGVGHFLRGGSSKVAASGGLPRIPFQGAQVHVNKIAISFLHPWLSVSSISNIRANAW